jgi:bacteriocin biosynthesis cyclodehydratase domain-containing protein
VRRRLRLVDDLALFPMPDGLGVQIRGAGAPIVLRGKRVDEALSFLVPRLDGRRTLRSILREGRETLPERTLLGCLRILEEAGLLAPGTRDPRALGRDAANDSQRRFFERQIGRANALGSGGEAQRRISCASVTLLASGAFGRETHALLVRSGIQRVRVIRWDDAPGNPPWAEDESRLETTSIPRALEILGSSMGGARLVVTATRNAPDALHAAINRMCLERRVPWIRGNDAAGTLDLGPTVLPFESACFRCLSLRAISANDLAIEERLYQDHLATERPAGETAPRGELCALAALGASLLTLEGIRILSGASPPRLVDAVWSIGPRDSAIEEHRFLRAPRCPHCSSQAASVLEATNVSGGCHARACA